MDAYQLCLVASAAGFFLAAVGLIHFWNDI